MYSIVAFGTELIVSQDLDPIYTVLHHSEMPRDQLKRWLFAYWCFYHAGFASYASEAEGEVYWKRVTQAARNLSGYGPNRMVSRKLPDRWPRGTERRHFRGEKCVNAIDWFRGWELRPEAWVDSLYENIPNPTHKDIISRVTKWIQFGPWIGFKVADMLERCLGVPVTFSDEITLIYKEPRKALDILATSDESPYQHWEVKNIYYELQERFSYLQAPPALDRPCSHQELETVLCKWKSHINGHYPMGKDSLELFEALEGWGSTANKLQTFVPDVQ
jgi:hypothetical protein